MYLDALAAAIRKHVPAERIPEGDTDDLFRLYAILLRAKGLGVTSSDVHDAWSAWMARLDDGHASVVRFEELSESVKREDSVFVTAIRRASGELDHTNASRASFAEILFPTGVPTSEAECRQAFDLYKIMVDSSEALVGRRQGVNTFFLTMNGALLTASGLIVQGSSFNRFGALGIAVLSVAGAILCGAWRSLIISFGQLNRGKFRVINTIEQHLQAAIYAAEWEALGRGEDPIIYRSFTSREIWVPNALLALHSLAALVAVVVAAGWITIVAARTPN